MYKGTKLNIIKLTVRRLTTLVSRSAFVARQQQMRHCHSVLGRFAYSGVISAKVAVVLVALLLPTMADAGQVVVRKSTDPEFDAFAVRDEVLKQHDWQEALRRQEQLQILQSLPLGCLMLPTPYRYYSCGGLFYRPYQQGENTLYIQIDPPSTLP